MQRVSVPGCKQPLRMGNDSKTTNTWIFMEGGREPFTPEKIDELVKKDKRGYLLDVVVKYPKELHEITMSCHFSRENEN